MPLTLYRRHTTTCLKGYPQNQRVYFPTTKKLRALDCECPIAAEGQLAKEYLTNKSLRTTNWDDAHEIAEKWEEWGQTTEPLKGENDEEKSIEFAVATFLESIGPKGENIEPTSIAHYEILLNMRLLPWCAKKTYSLLREFDDLHVVTQFVESWVNLNPTRNRKGAPIPKEPVLLADSTKKQQLELLRYFLKYCVARKKWGLTTNYAEQISFSSKTEPKFGLEPHEEEWFFDEISKMTDGHYRIDQDNAFELRVFCQCMRHGGLRISDAVKLDDTAIVQRASGEGWAMKLYQQKTKEWVYIPIPDYVEANLRKLPVKGEKDGKRYWFWSGVGKQKTAISNFYGRIMKIVKRVESDPTKGKFTNSVSPHTFRHTFSIRHLNAGVDIKQVSRWLGHKSVAVTEKHYAHAIQGTMIQSEEAYDASMKRQAEQAAAIKRRKLKVVR